jgi:prephenate dehydrogenase
MIRKKVAIVGTGLIGGSMAIKLHELKLASHIIGVETNATHAGTALKLQLIDEILPMSEAVQQADVVVLAVPVDVTLRLLPAVLDLVSNQVVFDTGSTKASVLSAIADHPHRKRFVATHPMWGTEYSGPESALRTAFENKACVICDAAGSDSDALDWVVHSYNKMGMHLLYMDAIQHDIHAAYVSHISHITSFALANTVLEKEKEEMTIFELASAGFESTVRLAKSSPAMWLPIFLQNKNNILDVIKEHISQLEHFRQAIEMDDEHVLLSLMEKANTIKKIIR